MDKKELILKSALALFSSNGYKQTSTLLIATKAGVSEGLVFKHFKSKEKLLGEVLKRGIRQMEKSLSPYKEVKDPRLATQAHLDLVVAMIKHDPTYWKLIYRIKFQITEIKSLQMIWKQHLEEMATIITANFKKAKVKKNKEEALVFMALVDGVLSNYLQQFKEYPINNVIKIIKEKY